MERPLVTIYDLTIMQDSGTKKSKVPLNKLAEEIGELAKKIESGEMPPGTILVVLPDWETQTS